MTTTNKKIELTDDQIEQILLGAMRLHGMLPFSVQEVAALDADLDSYVPPFSPTDPNELLKRLGPMDSVKIATALPTTPLDTPSVRNLAHAAREGGELTPEIEQQMVADKARFLREGGNDQ